MGAFGICLCGFVSNEGTPPKLALLPSGVPLKTNQPGFPKGHTPRVSPPPKGLAEVYLQAGERRGSAWAEESGNEFPVAQDSPGPPARCPCSPLFWLGGFTISKTDHSKKERYPYSNLSNLADLRVWGIISSSWGFQLVRITAAAKNRK